MQKYKFISNSSEQTKKFAKIFGQEILKESSNKRRAIARVFCLHGNLGAGKTTFMQGLAKGLGIKEKILSPTFSLMKKFRINNQKTITNNQKSMIKYLYHLDCYRLSNEKDLEALNWKNIISDSKNIIFIEWPERIKKALSKNSFWIEIKNLGRDKREIYYTN